MSGIAIVSGPSALRSYVKAQISELRRSSCLIVTSSSPFSAAGNGATGEDAVARGVSHFVQRSNFVLTMECNLRTVGATVSSAYPTVQDVESAAEVARRAGAETIFGIGSGAAVDLAKAVSRTLKSGAGNLILAPATIGSVMASVSDSTLLLSPQEEALLLPQHAMSDINGGPQQMAFRTVALDGDDISVPQIVLPPKQWDRGGSMTASVADAAISALAVCVDTANALDTCGGNGTTDGAVDKLIDKVLEDSVAALHLLFHSSLREGADSEDGSVQLDSDTQRIARRHAAAAVLHAGQLLSFGVAREGHGLRRSIPMAFCSALLPRYFPHGHILTYMASTFPALCSTLCQNGSGTALDRTTKAILEQGPMGSGKDAHLIDWAERVTSDVGVPPMASLAEGAPDVGEMLNRLDANGALVGCIDAQFNLLEGVLHRSLNR